MDRIREDQTTSSFSLASTHRLKWPSHGVGYCRSSWGLVAWKRWWCRLQNAPWTTHTVPCRTSTVHDALERCPTQCDSSPPYKLALAPPRRSTGYTPPIHDRHQYCSSQYILWPKIQLGCNLGLLRQRGILHCLSNRRSHPCMHLYSG